MAIDWQFYHWHLEPSSFCALQCPRCPRTEHPETPWLNQQMSLDFFKSFMTPTRLHNQVKRITMCGDVGDPIYCKEYVDICRYIKQHNPDIHIVTVTNGSNRSVQWWEELSLVLNHRDCINFSIDGYDHYTNNLYRIGSNWESILQGIRTVRDKNQSVFLTWAAIVFDFNQDHIDDIWIAAKSLGMDTLQLTHSTKFGSKYGAAYQGDKDQLEPRPQFVSESHRYQRIEINLGGRVQDRHDYLEHNTQRFLDIQQKYQSNPIVPLCEIGNRGIYINAEGTVFPCSWVSFPYTSLAHQEKTIHWKDSFFAKHREKMNLRHRSLEEILIDPLWNHCSQGWQNDKKSWVECSQKCSTKLVNKDYAVGWATN